MNRQDGLQKQTVTSSPEGTKQGANPVLMVPNSAGRCLTPSPVSDLLGSDGTQADDVPSPAHIERPPPLITRQRNPVQVRVQALWGTHALLVNTPIRSKLTQHARPARTPTPQALIPT